LRGTWDDGDRAVRFRASCLYIADEVFFTGTAAEVQPIRSIDRVVIGDGKPGEITKKIADEFFGIVNGLKPDRFGWLTPVFFCSGLPGVSTYCSFARTCSFI
jgi:hypothetical protein